MRAGGTAFVRHALRDRFSYWVSDSGATDLHPKLAGGTRFPTAVGSSVTTQTEVVYETKAVKTVRGLEPKTRTKLEGEGWEFVSQTVGTLRSELTFRRPKPKPPWKLLAILGGVLIVLFIFIAIMAAITGGNDANEPTSAQSPAPSSPAAAPDDEGESTTDAEAVTPVAPTVVDTTVDEVLDRLTSADMGGIQLGDQFRFTGELFMSELWMTGAAGEYTVLLKAHDGQQDLMVFVDESDAAACDGTQVEMVVESVEATINGETTGGWSRAVSVTTLP
jgi:hypothetical protein